jgi:tetratricopeptide (TPR) repeat protein
LSLRDDAERETVQELVSRFRRLPEETRRKLPALWNSLGQLQLVVGDLDSGCADFQEVARLVGDPISRAEAHHNVYRAALERRDWDGALQALRRAVALDAEAFEPFPFSRYEPQRILGAGGLGVSFLCKDAGQGGRLVVVKLLRGDTLDRDVPSLLAEARVQQELDHPTLLGVVEAGFAGGTSGSEAQPRLYLVLDYFEGETLAEHVARNGPLSPDDWLDVAWPVLRALQALHGRGILHRALRPGTILVRRAKNRDGASRLDVRLIDTGLALKRAVIHAAACNPDACRHTGLGRSVARLLPYAPPEVVGRPKGQVWVGPHSDLYSFGRLCAFGLTGRPDPDAADRMLLPEGWQKLIDGCVGWTINRRPAHAGAVLDELAQLPGADERIGRIERDVNESAVAALTARIESAPDDLAAILQRAAAYFRQGDLESAIPDYSAAILLRPEDASLYRRRAQAYARANRPDDAIADYTESLRLEPRNPEALASRGLAYAQKGEPDKAIADYTEGLRLNPRDELLYYNRGNAHYSKGDFPRAVADYTEALRLEPRGLWSLGNRGKAYLLNGESARACADFTRLLQLDPANVKALADRAEANLRLGRVEAAVADYTEAIRLEPTAGLYHDRGMAWLRSKEYAAAIADFTEALALSPDNAALLTARGQTRAEAGQDEEALADYTEALRVAPKSTLALRRRAAVYQRLGRGDEALADLTAAIEGDPDVPGLRTRRGRLYAERGDGDRAIADFTEAIRLLPEDTEALRLRGEALARAGEFERALADLGRALELGPDDAAAWSARAALRERLGDTDGAVVDLTELLRVEPADVEALLRRGGLYLSLRRYQAALADNLAAHTVAPADGRVTNNLGWLYAATPEDELRDPAKALEFARQAVAAGETAGRLDTLAAAHATNGQFAEAVACQKRALELAAPGEQAELRARLELYEQGRPFLLS